MNTITLEHNAGVVAVRLHARAGAVFAEVQGELRTLSARIAAAMRLASPKFRSLLANSVRADPVAGTALRRTRGTGTAGTWRGGLDVIEWFIAPHTEYAKWVEKGRPPGKGLPRFFDPAAAQIVAWLEGHPAGGGSFRRPRKGSGAAVRHELELRDRYMALSRHVRAHGIKARPFVAETAAEFRDIVPRDLAAAVHRALEGGAA